MKRTICILILFGLSALPGIGRAQHHRELDVIRTTSETRSVPLINDRARVRAGIRELYFEAQRLYFKLRDKHELAKSNNEIAIAERERQQQEMQRRLEEMDRLRGQDEALIERRDALKRRAQKQQVRLERRREENVNFIAQRMFENLDTGRLDHVRNMARQATTRGDENPVRNRIASNLISSGMSRTYADRIAERFLGFVLDEE